MRLAYRNVAYNLAGQALPMAVALVSLPVLAHQAGTERLGFLGLAWSLIGYFALLDLGLSRIVTRRVAIADDRGLLGAERAVVRSLCIRLFAVVAVVSIALALFVPSRWVIGAHASPDVATEARIALPILLLTLPATVVTGLLRGALEGVQRFARANALKATFGALSFGAPLAVLPFRTDLVALTAAVAAVRIVALVAHAAWALDALGPSTRPDATPDGPAHDPPSLAATIREGGWLTVSNVVGPLMVTFDRFVIAAMVSLTATSWYFVPQETALRLLVVPAAVATTIFPMLARLGGVHADRQRISHDALLAIAATSLPAAAVLAAFAQPLLSVWMGAEFARSAAPVAAIIAVGLFANCCAQAPFAWVQAAGRADVTGRLHLAQLPFYGLLLVGLTWRFGIVGTAIAWSVRAVADCGLLFVASARLFPDVKLGPVLRAIVAGLALLVLLALHPALPEGVARTAFATTLFVAAVILSAILALRLRPRHVAR